MRDILSYEVDQQNLEESNSAGCSLEFYALPSASQKTQIIMVCQSKWKMTLTLSQWCVR